MVTLLPRPPLPELLQGIAQLIRTGLPPLLESPEWPAGEPAPAEHWLVPEGTKIFTYDKAGPISSPALLIEQTGKAERTYPNSLAYWKIPVHVTLLLAREPSADEILTLSAKLFRMFTESLPTGDAETITPWDRLTAACLASSTALEKPEWCHVFTHGIDDAETPPVEDKNGHPMVQITMTIHCALATELEAAA